MALRAVAPPIYQPPLWGSYGLSADQTTGFSVGSPVRFNVVRSGALPISGYQVVLPQGKIFRLQAGLVVGFVTGTTANVQAAWYNVTGSQYFPGGVVSFQQAAISISQATSQQTSSVFVDTAGGSITVRLQIFSGTQLEIIRSAWSFAEITEFR